jgi:hypothetical protein
MINEANIRIRSTINNQLHKWIESFQEVKMLNGSLGIISLSLCRAIRSVSLVGSCFLDSSFKNIKSLCHCFTHLWD